jgi:hypothetical protein
MDVSRVIGLWLLKDPMISILDPGLRTIFSSSLGSRATFNITLLKNQNQEGDYFK